METFGKWFMPKDYERMNYLTVSELYKIITSDIKYPNNHCSEDISCPRSKHGGSECATCAAYIDNKQEVLNYIKKQSIKKLKL
jgi:hypothetical protein